MKLNIKSANIVVLLMMLFSAPIITLVEAAPPNCEEKLTNDARIRAIFLPFMKATQDVIDYSLDNPTVVPEEARENGREYIEFLNGPFSDLYESSCGEENADHDNGITEKVCNFGQEFVPQLNSAAAKGQRLKRYFLRGLAGVMKESLPSSSLVDRQLKTDEFNALRKQILLKLTPWVQLISSDCAVEYFGSLELACELCSLNARLAEQLGRNYQVCSSLDCPN